MFWSMVRAHLGPQKNRLTKKFGVGFFVFLMLITVSNYAFRKPPKSRFYGSYRKFGG